MEILKIEIWGKDVFKTLHIPKVDLECVKEIALKHNLEFLVIDRFSVIGTGQFEQAATLLENRIYGTVLA